LVPWQYGATSAEIFARPTIDLSSAGNAQNSAAQRDVWHEVGHWSLEHRANDTANLVNLCAVK
jgi:hypothetical protein